MAGMPMPPKKKTRVKGPVSGTPLKRAAPRPYAPAKSGPKTVTRSAGDISGNPILRAAPRPYAPAKAGPGRQMMARPKAMPKGMPNNAMKTGADKNNPLHRMLSGKAKP